MNFWQTIAGDKFLNVSIPKLINGIDSLTDELKKLNQEIESKAVSLFRRVAIKTLYPRTY